MNKEEIAAALDALKENDGDAAGARLFSLVYPTRPDILEVAKDAYMRFFSENALNPMTFPSLARLESDVLDFALRFAKQPGVVHRNCRLRGQPLTQALVTLRELAALGMTEEQSADHLAGSA